MNASAPLLPVSLGHNCRVRFQLVRALYARQFPDRTADDFRRALYGRHEDARLLPGHLFDWQITMPSTICNWLDRDFAGAFERADLEPSPDGSETRHRRDPNVTFPHNFSHPVTHASIDAEYGAARDKFDALSQRFRDLRDQPAVFVLFAPKTEPATLKRLQALLRNYSTATSNLLVADIPEPASKPPELAWEGDDDAWGAFIDRHFDIDALLRYYRRPHDSLRHPAEFEPIAG